MYYPRTEKENNISAIVSFIVSFLVSVCLYKLLNKTSIFSSWEDKLFLPIIFCIIIFLIFLVLYWVMYGIMYLLFKYRNNKKEKLLEKEYREKIQSDKMESERIATEQKNARLAKEEIIIDSILKSNNFIQLADDLIPKIRGIAAARLNERISQATFNIHIDYIQEREMLCGIDLFERGIKIVNHQEFWKALQIYLKSNKNKTDTDHIHFASINTYTMSEDSIRIDSLRITVTNPKCIDSPIQF